MRRSTSGRIVKISKTKKGTVHQRSHRWESFTTKIAKLNSLDPLRRVRRHDLESEDLSATTSYLKNGLDKWQELNVSGRFVGFVNEVVPLCDSLPQIIHFEDIIMDLLVTHLEMKERESLEPLLHLMTDFVHDLGVRFEKHYARALQLVTSIARTSLEVDVIEWSFECLAFMFKYLSKLLVSDLRPTYDIMAPLLRKENHKPHIARFAAEAMSFLIKKAAAPAVRGKSLHTIVPHVRSDLISISGSREYSLYYYGLMTMFSEAIKGNGQSIHSSGVAVLHCLFSQLEENECIEDRRSPWAQVICGILTSLVHHSNSEALKDIMAAVIMESASAVDTFKSAQDMVTFHRLMVSARSLGILAGVRKGSRVDNWPGLLKALLNILKALSSSNLPTKNGGDHNRLWDSIVLSVSIAFVYAPMDAILPLVSDYMTALTTEPLSTCFFMFCSHYSELDAESFRSIVLPYFQRFVIAHWSEGDNDDELCILLPKLAASNVLTKDYGGKVTFTLPQSWQDQIVSKFERLEVSPFPEQGSNLSNGKSPQAWHDRCLPKYRGLLEILDSTATHPSTNARIAEILLRKLKLALRPSSALAPEETHFIVGYGFKVLTRMMDSSGPLDVSLGPLLRAAAPRYSRLPIFLEAMILYESTVERPSTLDFKTIQSLPNSSMWCEASDDGPDLLIESLVDNLCVDVHDLRLLSLQLLDHIFKTSNGFHSEVLAVMLLIEQTPLDLQNSRSASMHIRKLASIYKSNASDPVFRRAIPFFCFGMLVVKFAQISVDACEALAQIAETSAGEEVIAGLAFRWLETPSLALAGSVQNIDQARSDSLTDFECSNLVKLDTKAVDVQSELQTANLSMLQRFETEQELVNYQPAAARSQAVRVLKAIPRIAERRSRQFIPMFLSWVGRDEDAPEEATMGSPALKSDWSRRDQKSQLEILGLFTNPKVLYKATEVYAALLTLIANGDVEIQKSALKAIFVWKLASIRPYEEILLNLLDEARFKDEITLLFHSQTLIQSKHRTELMPVILKLLYGRSIARKGTTSGRQGMEARRLIILRSLKSEDIGEFVDIALGELQHINITGDAGFNDSLFKKEIVSVRRQHGFLNMMEDVVRELGNNVGSCTSKILPAILFCLVFASRQLQKAEYSSQDEKCEDSDRLSMTSMFKANRQTGYKCLVLLFTNDNVFDWSALLPIILQDLVIPRLEKLPIETAQSISGVLRLLSSWSLSPRTVLFLGRDKRILTSVTECLIQQKAKDQVKLFALGIIRHIVAFAHHGTDEGEELALLVRSTILNENMETFLMKIAIVLRYQQDPGKELLEACVEAISELAPFVSKSSQAYNLVDISVFLLDQPSRRINPKTKSGLLQVLERFIPLYNLQEDLVLRGKIYNTVTSLFGYFRDRPSREILSRVLLAYSQTDQELSEIASLCADLNSFNDGKLGEPDYDRRLRAFTSIAKERAVPFTASQWQPLLYNMLFYIRHDEEFGILSSNSSDGICNFLKTAREAAGSLTFTKFEEMLSSIVLPAIYLGVHEDSEFIRREYLKVAAHLVRTFPDWADVSDMHVLLGGDDELEGSFFNNILTAGKGRQSSALRQLAIAANRGLLNSYNVNQLFIPLIEHFIFHRAEGSEAHSLAAEATTTLGLLAGSLEWPQYRALLRKFISYITSKPNLEKQVIRLLGKIIDSIALAAKNKGIMSQIAIEDAGLDIHLKTPTRAQVQDVYYSTLSRTLPEQAKLTEDLMSNILPALLTYLHDKDESTVSLRVPVAVIAVRLLKLLPEEKMAETLPAVLTDICHILRSKSQESRDMTRDTLNKICVLLGPSCFGFVLKELRGALARGYQLHVLSYTMHSILVATTPEYSPGDLDYCLPSIVAIIMDDIFGVAGQEKDAEEYVSKMKEVKSSKSHDSMELIAMTATLSRLTDLVRPVQALLKEKLNLRMIRKIDELLSRISTGLLKNIAVKSRESLVFCYEIIQDAYPSSIPQSKVKEDYRLKKYLLQRGAYRNGSRGSTTLYTYKLVRFAFDVMRSVLKKHDNLRTASNLAGFFPILGDALVAGEDEVKVSAFRLLTTIIKVPVKFSNDGQDLYRIAAKEATKVILSSSTTTSDISQAALKLISVILRDRTDISIKDTVIDELLGRLKDDITDPERRHVTFSFLRAVLDSKMLSAILYDTLDYVGTVMVTNDDKDTRDLARGAYFQFLREYPQKRNRWTKQLAFIVTNLKYEREGGRLSILEVIHLLLSKSSNEFIQEVSATCFVPLIFVLANDDSEKCRMASGELVKEIFKKADRQQLHTFLSLLRSWIAQRDNPSVMRLGFLNYRLYYEARAENIDEDEIAILQASILAVLREMVEPESDWELTYAALQLMSILCEKFPKIFFAQEVKGLWAAVQPCLSYPHVWVKLSSARLLAIYFADFVRGNVEDGLGSLPLRGSQGLLLSAEDIKSLIRRLAGMFKTPNLTGILVEEIVKNLFFLGRCAWESNLTWTTSYDAEDDLSDEVEIAVNDNEQKQYTALNYIFERLSFILRKEPSPPRAPTLIPKTAALQLLQLLCSKLPPEALSSSLQTILLPLQNLTDPNIPMPYSTDNLFKSGYEALRASSLDLMSLLQTRCGTSDYTLQMLRVREGVKARRNQRSSKRKIEAVAVPEKYGRDKQKKVERKKERRRERGLEHRDQRRGW